jgi:alpha-1,2-mannosyltransferase
MVYRTVQFKCSLAKLSVLHVAMMASNTCTLDADDAPFLPPLVLIVSVLSTLPLLTYLLGPKIIAAASRPVGWYLRRKTAGRRAQILERVEDEEKALAEDQSVKKDSDDEWENVESYAAGSAKNGEKADKEWDGVVGFFHPFW